MIFLFFYETDLTIQIKYANENIFAFQLQPSQDHVSAPESRSCPPVAAQAENMGSHVAAGRTFMEAAVSKHGRISQRPGPGAARLPEVRSGFFANRTSLTDSADSLTPTASSRESLLSEDLDKDRGWRMGPCSVTSPASLSRTVSPCSSVLSGIFSPTVVQIRKHFLAPGSSLIHTPQTCFSSCENLSSSSCPQSPTPRRRPPLTRLSLLTAILRKGRLPVLSPAVQRPYTPCWPVNPVTLSFCKACSAASSVASIPLELSSQFSSTTSIDSQSHGPRQPDRRTPAPVPSNPAAATCPETRVKGGCSEQIGSSSAPRWAQVLSPPANKPETFPHISPHLPSCSDSGSVSPAPQAHKAATKVQHGPNVFISKSFKLEPRIAHVKGHADILPVNCASSKHICDQKTPGHPRPAKYASLSKLHMLSEKLRSPPRASFHPSPSPSSARAASPLPPLRPAARSSHSDRSANTSEGSHKAPSLPPTTHSHACSPRWLLPVGSPTPTPSPAPPGDLSLFPCLSLRSTPSPRLESDHSDREGKKTKVVIEPA